MAIAHAPGSSHNGAMELQMDSGGWLRGVPRQPSPNFNARPPGVCPELLIVHNISLPPGEFGTGQVAALFCNTLDCDAHEYFDGLRGLEVSAHFLIDRVGQLTQFVSCDDRAWHAGVSRWGRRDNCNDFSIGIELEGTDRQPYAAQQYETLVDLCVALRAHYPSLGAASVVGHSDVAPGRKTDPGDAFDWTRLRRMLR